jgi:hypothetical protein
VLDAVVQADVEERDAPNALDEQPPARDQKCG